MTGRAVGPGPVHRRPFPPRIGVVSPRILVSAVVCALAVGACADDGAEPAGPTEPTTTTVPPEVVDRLVETGAFAVDEPAAMAVGPDGSLFVGERRTGRIWSVPADQLGTARPDKVQVAQLDVATDGQQGLLGLAVAADGTVYAGMTRPGPGEPRQVVVRLVSEGPPEAVWVGPVAATGAIGGRLAWLPDGRLLLGMGDFLRGSADSFDADEPFSKLLSLDPAGPADQEPVVVSEGWNNPFAFAVGPDGAVWVADNAPGDTPERLGRGDGGGAVIELDPPERAPSGLAVLDAGELVLCGYLSGVAELVTLTEGEVAQPSEVLAAPCELGVVALFGGGLAVAVQDEVRLLAPSN
jgi:hypothetical protein